MFLDSRELTLIYTICTPYRFVEHAGLSVLVLSIGTVHESVAENMVIHTPVSTHGVGGWTCKSLHPVICQRALWETKESDKLVG